MRKLTDEQLNNITSRIVYQSSSKYGYINVFETLKEICSFYESQHEEPATNLEKLSAITVIPEQGTFSRELYDLHQKLEKKEVKEITCSKFPECRCKSIDNCKIH